MIGDMRMSNDHSATIWQAGTGYVMPTVLADLMVLFILGYLVFALYSPIKKLVEFRKVAKQVGGPKGHWFWGDAKKVSF